MEARTSQQEPPDREKAPEDGEKTPAEGRAPRKGTQSGEEMPDEQDSGRRTLSRPQQADLRRKLREKFH